MKLSKFENIYKYYTVKLDSNVLYLNVNLKTGDWRGFSHNGKMYLPLENRDIHVQTEQQTHFNTNQAEHLPGSL